MDFLPTLVLIVGGFWLIASSLSLGRAYRGKSAAGRTGAACLLGAVAGVVIAALFVVAVGLAGVTLTIGIVGACFFIVVGSSLLVAAAIVEIGARLTLEDKGD